MRVDKYVSVIDMTPDYVFCHKSFFTKKIFLVTKIFFLTIVIIPSKIYIRIQNWTFYKIIFCLKIFHFYTILKKRSFFTPSRKSIFFYIFFLKQIMNPFLNIHQIWFQHTIAFGNLDFILISRIFFLILENY